MALSDNLIAYYKLDGNSNDSSYKSLFNDDFAGTSLDTGKWTLQNGTSTQSSGVLTVTANSSSYCNFFGSTPGDRFSTLEWYGSMPQTTVGTVYFGYNTTLTFLHKWQDTTKTYINDGVNEVALDAKYTGNHTWKIARNGANVTFSIDGVVKYTSTVANTNTIVPYFRIYGKAGENTFTLDWINMYYGSAIGGSNGTDTDIIYSQANGKLFQGAGFNGSSSFIKLPNGARSGNSVSVSLWFNVPGYVSWQYLWSEGSGVYASISIYHDLIRVTNRTTTADMATFIDINEISYNTWNHVVYNYDSVSGYLKIYLNNILIINENRGGNQLYSGSSYHSLGNYLSSVGLNGTLNGKIDEVGLWSRSLTEDEIKELYNDGIGKTYPFESTLGEFIPSSSTKLLLHLNGNSTDSSGNGNNGTDTAITYSQANGKFGQGVYSSGGATTRRIVVPSSASLISPTNNMTCSFWCNLGSLVKQTTPLLMRLIPSASPYNCYVFEFNTTGISFAVNTSSGVICSSSTVLTTGVWYNIIGTYNGSNIRLYLNGNLLTEIAQTGNINYGSGRELRIADNETGQGQFYTGSVDECIIEDRAWSAEEVKKYYTQSRGMFGIL